MFWFLKKSSGSKASSPTQTVERDEKRYEKEKEIAHSDNEKKRMTLAKSSKTHQEILYYLAEKDPSPKVRKAVASNASTPVHAAGILAEDSDEDVRLALAGRLVDLLPELETEKQSQLYAFAVQALSTLALDEVIRVRKALSSTLQDYAHTPPKVAGQLARDVEREVSEPILLHCVALSDDDLLDILKEHPAGWAIEAIAGRANVSETVSEAVIDTDHEPAGAVLIRNEGAVISGSLLEVIVEKAQSYPEWQGSLASRKTLSPEAAKVLAGFVDDSVRKVLLMRSDFDPEATEEITEIVRRRIAFEEDAQSGKKPADRVSEMYKEGKLDEQTISDALAMRDNDFVMASLAFLLNSNVKKITGVFETQSSKGIVALCWKANLSMRLALQLQKQIGQIQPDKLLYPKEGSGCPLSQEEIDFQLEFLGLKAA